MNEHIKSLLPNPFAVDYQYKDGPLDLYTEEEMLRFAESIVKECIKQCNQEWYDLNNAAPVENELPRDIGIRVGQKNGVLKSINRIKKHFGVEQ